MYSINLCNQVLDTPFEFFIIYYKPNNLSLKSNLIFNLVVQLINSIIFFIDKVLLK